MLFDLKRTLNKIEINNNNNNKKSKRQAAGPHKTSITYSHTHTKQNNSQESKTIRKKGWFGGMHRNIQTKQQ